MIINCKHRKTVGFPLNSDNDISFITRVSYSYLNCLSDIGLSFTFRFDVHRWKLKHGLGSHLIGFFVSVHLLTMTNIQNERNTEKCMSMSSYQPHTMHTTHHTPHSKKLLGTNVQNARNIGYATEKMGKMLVNDGWTLKVSMEEKIWWKYEKYSEWSCLRVGSLLRWNNIISMAFHQTINVM